MDAKKFLVQIPRLCHAPNAERFARMIELQYDDEMDDKNSVFARNTIDVENPYNRMETIFCFRGDYGRIQHCHGLVALMGLKHYRDQHGEKRWDADIAALETSTRQTEPLYPDIAAVMSVDEIMSEKSETWNG